MVLTAIEVRQKGKTRKMFKYAFFRRKPHKKADFSEVTCLESLQKLQNKSDSARVHESKGL